MIVLFIALVVAPILFVLFTWTAATAYRIYFPERPMPFSEQAVVQRERMTLAGEHVPVGVREIRADQRRHQRSRRRRAAYHYAGSASEGFPPDWQDDLWRRRN